MAREGRYVISVCCMKNYDGNIVSDADDMKDIWRKCIVNVENGWDGEVFCPDVMGHVDSFMKIILPQLSKD